MSNLGIAHVMFVINWNTSSMKHVYLKKLVQWQGRDMLTLDARFIIILQWVQNSRDKSTCDFTSHISDICSLLFGVVFFAKAAVGILSRLVLVCDEILLRERKQGGCTYTCYQIYISILFLIFLLSFFFMLWILIE